MTELMTSLVRGYSSPPSFCSLKRTSSRSSSRSDVGMVVRSRMMLPIMLCTFLWHLAICHADGLTQRISCDDGYKSTKLNPLHNLEPSSKRSSSSFWCSHLLPTDVRIMMSLIVRNIFSPMSMARPLLQSLEIDRTRRATSSYRMGRKWSTRR